MKEGVLGNCEKGEGYKQELNSESGKRIANEKCEGECEEEEDDGGGEVLPNWAVLHIV